MNVLGFHIGRANAAPAVAAPAEPTGGAGEAMAMAMMAALGHAAKSSEDAAGTPTGRATRLTKGLTPVKLAGYLDEFYAGNFRNIAQLWDTMEDGDTVCAPVAEKRKKKITGELRDYTVEAVDDTPAAEKQAEFLRTFLDSGIRGEHALRPAEHGGLRKAVEYMADAVGKKYSFLGKVWEQDGDQLKLTLRFVPLWHFKEADDGSYRYYPNPNSTLSSTAVKEEEWVIGVRSRAIMQAACLAVTLRRLPVQQVARALEKFGVPNVIGTTTAEFGSPGWDAMYTALVSYMSGMPALLSEGNDLNVLESSF
ncbi:MAG: DUF935 family protein, partial [Victivallales bacterium]|nr:DUF935 family protein [Victivallales bacterium]